MKYGIYNSYEDLVEKLGKEEANKLMESKTFFIAEYLEDAIYQYIYGVLKIDDTDKYFKETFDKELFDKKVKEALHLAWGKGLEYAKEIEEKNK